MNSLFKVFLIKIDAFFCSYLGLSRTYSRPEKVAFISDSLFITNTESNKRHLHTIPFKEMNLSEYSDEDKDKLGKAIGKSIATNLIVKFQ